MGKAGVPRLLPLVVVRGRLTPERVARLLQGREAVLVAQEGRRSSRRSARAQPPQAGLLQRARAARGRTT